MTLATTGHLVTLNRFQERTWNFLTYGVTVQTGAVKIVHPSEGEFYVKAGESKQYASAAGVKVIGFFKTKGAPNCVRDSN